MLQPILLFRSFVDFSLSDYCCNAPILSLSEYGEMITGNCLTQLSTDLHRSQLGRCNQWHHERLWRHIVVQEAHSRRLHRCGLHTIWLIFKSILNLIIWDDSSLSACTSCVSTSGCSISHDVVCWSIYDSPALSRMEFIFNAVSFIVWVPETKLLIVLNKRISTAWDVRVEAKLPGTSSVIAHFYCKCKSKFLDLEREFQSDGSQNPQGCHLMANIKIYKQITLFLR